MNNSLLKSVVLVAVGLVGGWLLWGGSPAPESQMHDSMSMMTGALMSATGSEFDRAFLSEMITHHQGAVEMAELVLERSERPELKQLATDIISAQNKEIGMMKTWLATWFK